MAFFNDGSVPSRLANKGEFIEFFHLVSGTNVSFRAFLTSFEDQYTSTWNAQPVFGRMDPISTFQRTERRINLGWKVVAESEKNAKKNLNDVSKLIRMLYPSYSTSEGGESSSTHISGPPLLKLRFMNLIKDAKSGDGAGSDAQTSGLLGYIDGTLSNKPVLEDGFIEIEEENGVKIYPKTIEMSCTYVVLHTHPLGWEDADFRSESNYPYSSQLSPAATEREISTENAAERLSEELNARRDEVLESLEPGELYRPFGGVPGSLRGRGY
ncbi:MAG TPA: hypothetical protein DCM40_06075 [Maribacter sp.]|nr:hypothetical protein [Maribacter sp.]